MTVSNTKPDKLLFNVNSYVRVKLNDVGRKIHKDRHDRIFEGRSEPFPYTPPKEDGEGWSKWQLWQLMAIFGPHINWACVPPFETTIEIPS